MELIFNFLKSYKDGLIVVGWGLVAINWLISNAQANKREKRKETRTEIDAITKALSEVIAKCRKYYVAGPEDAEDDTRTAEIAFEVKRILVRTERLVSRVSEFSGAKEACTEFFDAVTQEPFSSKGRAKCSPGSEVLMRVEASVHNLIDKLEDGFTIAFVNPFWKRVAIKCSKCLCWRNG